MRCRGAALVLFHGFREDPLSRSIFRSLACLYSFFELLTRLAQLGLLKVLCYKEGQVTASAAILALRKMEASPAEAVRAFGKLLTILSCISLSGALRLAQSLAWLPLYAHAYQRVSSPCHLLFIASLKPGRGHGSKLLREVERECARLGGRSVVLEVDLENRALIFYSKRGYRPVAVTRFAGRDFLLMVKTIA